MHFRCGRAGALSSSEPLVPLCELLRERGRPGTIVTSEVMGLGPGCCVMYRRLRGGGVGGVVLGGGGGYCMPLEPTTNNTPMHTHAYSHMP